MSDLTPIESMPTDEGWQTQPEFLRTLVALRGMRAGDELIVQATDKAVREGHPALNNIMPSRLLYFVVDATPALDDWHRTYDNKALCRYEFWTLVAWRRPQ